MIWPLSGGHERIMLFLSPLKLYVGIVVVSGVSECSCAAMCPNTHLHNLTCICRITASLDQDHDRVIKYTLGGLSARSTQLTMDMKTEALEKILLNVRLDRALYILFPGEMMVGDARALLWHNFFQFQSRHCPRDNLGRSVCFGIDELQCVLQYKGWRAGFDSQHQFLSSMASCSVV
jgi:hypothetical protein